MLESRLPCRACRGLEFLSGWETPDIRFGEKWQLLVNPVDPEEGQEVIPAFTVGDLIRMLPPDEDVYNLVIERSPNRGWDVRYREIGANRLIRGKHDISLVGALVQMVEEIKREEDVDPLHIRRIYPYVF